MFGKPMKKCARCGERMNTNAFPRGSRTCYECTSKRAAATAAAEMPHMLQALRRDLADIEKDNDWEHRFVTGLVERFEIGQIKRLTDKQFEKLRQIYGKYH